MFECIYSVVRKRVCPVDISQHISINLLYIFIMANAMANIIVNTMANNNILLRCVHYYLSL